MWVQEGHILETYDDIPVNVKGRYTRLLEASAIPRQFLLIEEAFTMREGNSGVAAGDCCDLRPLECSR
jgi:hypothetical protein